MYWNVSYISKAIRLVVNHEGQIQGWLGLDSCFLKGLFKGKLLCAVGRDNNENIYLITIVTIEAKIKDSWS